MKIYPFAVLLSLLLLVSCYSNQGERVEVFIIGGGVSGVSASIQAVRMRKVH